MAEYYGTAIIPVRVQHPKDKSAAEGCVGTISKWITAALRNEQFFSLAELNMAIRQKLDDYSHKHFQKREGAGTISSVKRNFRCWRPCRPDRTSWRNGSGPLYSIGGG